MSEEVYPLGTWIETEPYGEAVVVCDNGETINLRYVAIEQHSNLTIYPANSINRSKIKFLRGPDDYGLMIANQSGPYGDAIALRDLISATRETEPSVKIDRTHTGNLEIIINPPDCDAANTIYQIVADIIGCREGVKYIADSVTSSLIVFKIDKATWEDKDFFMWFSGRTSQYKSEFHHVDNNNILNILLSQFDFYIRNFAISMKYTPQD